MNLLEFIKTKNWSKGLLQTSDPIKQSLLDELIQKTLFLSEDATLAERKWHIEHASNTLVLCSCGVPVKWNSRKGTYRKFCSTSCSNKNNNDKRIDSMILKYGVSNPMHYGAFKEKMIKTSSELDYSIINLKRQETNLAKFGVDNYFKTESSINYTKSEVAKDLLRKSKNKKIQTNLSLHGVANPSQRHINPDNILKLNDSDWLREEHYTNKRTAQDIAQELGVHSSTIGYKFKEFGITPLYFYTSQPEREIKEFINTLGVEVKTNVRNVIHGELDIYIPAHNLAIEYCGLYWHSDAVKIDNMYHRNKMDMCKKNGIRLITIFEDEWITNKNLVLNKLSNILGLSKEDTVYARKCSIVYITSHHAKDFLNKYHIQGDGPKTTSIGLSYNGQLVSVMALLSTKSGWVINRFASSCRVVGGFSKILKEFTRNNPNTNIHTFADLRWSNGDVYINNGFVLDAILKPDYYWTQGKQIDRYHKFGFRHISLKNKLANYDSTKSESENMYAHGYYKIWDCGKLRYKLS